MVRLGGLIEQIRGVSYKPEDVYDKLDENSVILLRANNIKDGQLNFDDVVYVDKKRVRDNQLLKAGDVLICTSSGSKELVGKAAYVREDLPMTFGAFCKVVRPQKIHPNYLGHFFNSPNYRQKISDSSTGANINNIRNEHIDELEILLPTAERQKYIAIVLDKLTGLISLRKQQLAKLDELVKARFVEMFGDLADPYCKFKKCTLAETCLDADDIKCGPFGTQLSKGEYQNEGIAVWEIPQINNGFTSKPTHFLTIEKAEQLKAYSIEPGDIAMSRKGNVGKCGVFPDYYEPGIIHSDVLRIRVDSKRVIPCFMMYQLHFSRAVQYQIETVSSGAIMAGINVTKLKQIEVYVPEYELQQRFSGFVGKVDRQKLTIQQSLDKLEVLRKSLMQEYFG